jgi:hypothetical protein
MKYFKHKQKKKKKKTKTTKKAIPPIHVQMKIDMDLQQTIEKKQRN